MGKQIHIGALASVFALAGLSAGCVTTSDPASPCAAVELGEAEPASAVAAEDSPVLAVAADPQPFVLHYVCPEFGECVLTKTLLDRLGPGNQIMITSAGHFVVALDADDNTLRWWDVSSAGMNSEPSGEMPIEANSGPVQLVASLRNSDWLLVRDEKKRLYRYLPGTHHTEFVAESRLKVVAFGEQHALAREVLDNSEERLVLLPIDESLAHANHAPVELLRSAPLTRVMLTPRDEYAVATSGEGDNAETFVFRVPDGKLVDRFVGGAVSGRRLDDEIPGLRAISPDGSHLAYRTSTGAVAMRNLDDRSSCLVRSSSAGDHHIAGFSAHGVLYMETDDGPGRSGVLAWSPSTRRLSQLSTEDAGFHLAAVPGREVAGVETPWAIGVRQGSFVGLQENGYGKSLSIDGALFMPRDASSIWVTEHSAVDSSSARKMTLREVTAHAKGGDRSYEFDAGDTTPDYYDAVEETMEEALSVQYSGSAYICMSTGTPGAWASRCGFANESGFLAGPGTPSSEDPNGTDPPSPNTPTPGGPTNCAAGGIARSEAGVCAISVGQCCYDNRGDACHSRGCEDHCLDSINERGEDTVVCGTGNDFP